MNSETQTRLVGVRLTEAEIRAVQDLTKVDAIATAVVAIVRKAIETERGAAK